MKLSTETADQNILDSDAHHCGKLSNHTGDVIRTITCVSQPCGIAEARQKDS
jgi:hypothetical protein